MTDKQIQEVKTFINYLNDKVEDCYKEETDITIQRFFERLENSFENDIDYEESKNDYSR